MPLECFLPDGLQYVDPLRVRGQELVQHVLRRQRARVAPGLGQHARQAHAQRLLQPGQRQPEQKEILKTDVNWFFVTLIPEVF